MQHSPNPEPLTPDLKEAPQPIRAQPTLPQIAMINLNAARRAWAFSTVADQKRDMQNSIYHRIMALKICDRVPVWHYMAGLDVDSLRAAIAFQLADLFRSQGNFRAADYHVQFGMQAIFRINRFVFAANQHFFRQHAVVQPSVNNTATALMPVTQPQPAPAAPEVKESRFLRFFGGRDDSDNERDDSDNESDLKSVDTSRLFTPPPIIEARVKLDSPQPTTVPTNTPVMQTAAAAPLVELQQQKRNYQPAERRARSYKHNARGFEMWVRKRQSSKTAADTAGSALEPTTLRRTHSG